MAPEILEGFGIVGRDKSGKLDRLIRIPNIDSATNDQLGLRFN